MTDPVKRRVTRHRRKLRLAGLRPVQLWVPDTRRKGFAREALRQSMLLRRDPLERRMVDKAQTVAREKIGASIGRLGGDERVAVERSLAVFLGFA